MTDLLPPPPPGSSPAHDEPTVATPEVAEVPAGRPVGRTEVATTAAAVAAAVAVGAIARFALGWHHPLALIAVAYAAFLAVSVAGGGELARWRSTLPDLDRGAGPAPHRPELDLRTEPHELTFRRPTPADAGADADAGRVAAPVPGVTDEDPDNDRPRSVRILGERDAWQAGCALAGSLALAGTLRVLLDWDGLMSTAVWAYLAFVVIYFALVWDHSGQEVAGDRIMTIVVWTAGALVLGGLLWMLGLLVIKGAPRLRPSFFTEDLSTVGPNDPGGGALHAVIGTLEQVGIAVVVVVPLAVLTAVYLHELKGRLAPAIRFVVDAMSGLPSIVAGLLVFTVWVNGRGFSGLAGSVALMILMLPTVTRTSEEILRTIPDSLREASLALGAPQWRVVLRVVVPTALSGLVTATILGVARAIGETAPMLLTAFGSDTVNTNPTNGPQSDLPLFVWKLINLPNEVQKQRAWTGALVLVLLVLILFVSARLVAGRARKRLGRAR